MVNQNRRTILSLTSQPALCPDTWLPVWLRTPQPVVPQCACGGPRSLSSTSSPLPPTWPPSPFLSYWPPVPSPVTCNQTKIRGEQLCAKPLTMYVYWCKSVNNSHIKSLSLTAFLTCCPIGQETEDLCHHKNYNFTTVHMTSEVRSQDKHSSLNVCTLVLSNDSSHPK